MGLGRNFLDFHLYISITISIIVLPAIRGLCYGPQAGLSSSAESSVNRVRFEPSAFIM